jgi:hypothetical protein
MADVFISYKRDERDAIERIAHQLRALGFEVWFDASMSAGDAFSDEIDREARAAQAILVCWSGTARDSRWVKAEAMIGFEQDKLAAAYVDGPDGFSPPTPFNTVHAADVRSYLSSPSETHAGWRSVLRRIGKLCRRPDVEAWGALDLDPASSEPPLKAWLANYAQSPLAPIARQALLDAQDWRLNAAERERSAREARERAITERAERERDLWRTRLTRRQGRIWSVLTGAALGLLLSPLDLAHPAAGWRPLGLVGFDILVGVVFGGPALMGTRWFVAIGQRRWGAYPRFYFDWPFLLTLAISAAGALYYAFDTRTTASTALGIGAVLTFFSLPIGFALMLLSFTAHGKQIERLPDPPFRTLIERFGWLLVAAVAIAGFALFAIGGPPTTAG